jgi:NAD(P)-dependent dehydrogenase (short-subunit alcohol dehydrogenase family)
VSDALRIEVARDGIRVILVEPGGFRTGVWDDFQHDVDARAESPYGPAYERLRSVVARSGPLMGRPEDCARVVASALTSPLPRTRYLVGLDAKLTALTAHTVPAPVRDRVLRAVLGL